MDNTSASDPIAFSCFLSRFIAFWMSPEIEFSDRSFCFTGSSPVAKRRQLEDVIAQLGGSPSPRVRKDFDYLVVGAEGNRCWAFSCYGRKVEAAVTNRKDGSTTAIVHENDFWDAAEDLGVERPVERAR